MDIMENGHGRVTSTTEQISAALIVWTPMSAKRNRGKQQKGCRDELQQYWELVHESKKPRPLEATYYMFHPAVD